MSGTRDELAASLDEDVEGWQLFGRDDLSGASADGAAQLRSGAQSVTVGHTTYEVREEGTEGP